MNARGKSKNLASSLATEFGPMLFFQMSLVVLRLALNAGGTGLARFSTS